MAAVLATAVRRDCRHGALRACRRGMRRVSMEQRVSVITLGVTDLGRAREFYRALGWRHVGADTDDVAFSRQGEWCSPGGTGLVSPRTARSATAAGGAG